MSGFDSMIDGIREGKQQRRETTGVQGWSVEEAIENAKQGKIQAKPTASAQEMETLERQSDLIEIKSGTGWVDRSTNPGVTRLGGSAVVGGLVFGPIGAVAASTLSAGGAVKNVKKHNNAVDALLMKAYDLSRSTGNQLSDAQIDEMMQAFDESREKNHQSRAGEANRNSVAMGMVGGVGGLGLGFFKGLFTEGLSGKGAKAMGLAGGLMGLVGVGAALLLGPLAPLALLLPVVTAAIGAVMGAFGGAILKSIKYAGAGAVAAGVGTRILKGNKDIPERAQFRATLMAASKKGVERKTSGQTTQQRTQVLNQGAKTHSQVDHVGEAPKPTAAVRPVEEEKISKSAHILEFLLHRIDAVGTPLPKAKDDEKQADIPSIKSEFVKLATAKYGADTADIFDALIDNLSGKDNSNQKIDLKNATSKGIIRAIITQIAQKKAPARSSLAGPAAAGPTRPHGVLDVDVSGVAGLTAAAAAISLGTAQHSADVAAGGGSSLPARVGGPDAKKQAGVAGRGATA